ncbi:MAG: dipeptide ABC transporter ATP-binding protein [Victivallales bacterium]
MPLLKVENLKTYYRVRGSWFSHAKYLRAVDDVSFELEAGETLGLVGESGCGKSTLGRTIIRLEKHSGGKISIGGKDISSLSGSELRKARSGFQMIFQDPYGSLNPRMTVFSALDEVLSIHSKLDSDARTERIVGLLEMVGLNAEQMHRYPHQFSGGQRQRVGIARALAVGPGLIVADEPVSALDVSVQAQIINLLIEIQKKTNVAFLFIAHDLAVVEHISRRIMVMYLGKIVESGLSPEITGNTRHPYTKALLSAVPVIDPVSRRSRIILPGDVPSPMNPPSGCPFHPRCPLAREKCRNEAPKLLAVKDGDTHLSACFFHGEVMKMGRAE